MFAARRGLPTNPRHLPKPVSGSIAQSAFAHQRAPKLYAVNIDASAIERVSDQPIAFCLHRIGEESADFTGAIGEMFPDTSFGQGWRSIGSARDPMLWTHIAAAAVSANCGKLYRAPFPS